MSAVAKLAASNVAVHRARTALTAVAIALSVSLVVAVTSGYATVENMAQRFVSRYMGTADAMVTKKSVSESRPTFADAIVAEMRKDPDVRRVTGRLEADQSVTGADGKTPTGIGHLPQVFGLDRPADTRVEQLSLRAGQWFDSADGDVAVIDQVASEVLHAAVGGTVVLVGLDEKGRDEKLPLKVVGIVQKPAVMASHIQSVYVPLHTLQRFLAPGKPPGINRVMIDLAPKANLDAFAARWRTRLAQVDPNLDLRLGRDVRDRLDQNLEGVHLMSYLGGTVAMLAATFIIFSALSMGVTERSRTLAMLRAIGASRGQVGRLVVSEGLLLAALGVAAGVPLGYGWLFLVPRKYRSAIPAAVTLSWGGVAFAAGTSAAAALAASLLPAWWATRVDPLEAMAPSAEAAPARRGPVVAAIVGLLLVAIDPTIMFGPWDRVMGSHAKSFVVAAHFLLGLPAAMLGFFLLAPAFVLVLERAAGPAVSWLAGVRPALLRQQLSGGVWRAAGTCAALMVGLAVLISMETEGHSMMAGWQLPDKFPDIFIVSWSRALDDAQIARIERVPGIRSTDVLPIAIASPSTGSSSEFALTMAALDPEGTMFFGIDAAKGMRMMELTFRQGTQEQAIAELQQGRHVIITDELHQLKHLNRGDKMGLVVSGGKTLDFTVSAVVYSPGVDLISSQFDMGRQMDQRTAGSLFGSMADAKKYFGVDGVRVVAANLEHGTSEDAVLKGVEKALDAWGLKAGDVRHIKEGMQKAFLDVLAIIAIVPAGALAVASLGVTNTIMASVRVRRWQLGVLRSVGLTRGQLVRLVLGEAALVGLVGAALGLVAGTVLTIDGHAMLNVVTGYRPAISVPWGIVSSGVGVVLGVSVLAGLWPAVAVARASPLSLLQGGRAAT
jgi:putative ABC transport system permease protein